MANNQYVNKVVYDNNTLIDISDTTAIGSDVRKGKVFYRSSGSRITGTLAIKYKDITGTFISVQLPGSTVRIMEASLDFTSIPDYQNLTKNNFSILEETLYFTGTFVPTSSPFKTIIFSYNQSTGILIVRFSADALKDTSTVKVRGYYI